MTTTTTGETKIMGAKFKFDRETCRRCGGTGHYSYNRTDGSTCYGCAGTGKVKTDQAVAAKRQMEAWLAEHLSIAATEIKPGDRVQISWAGHTKWVTVEDVRLNGAHVMLHYDRTAYGIYADSKIRRAGTDAERLEYREFVRTLDGVTVIEPNEEAAA